MKILKVDRWALSLIDPALHTQRACSTEGVVLGFQRHEKVTWLILQPWPSVDVFALYVSAVVDRYQYLSWPPSLDTLRKRVVSFDF